MVCKTCGETDPDCFRPENLSRCKPCIHRRQVELAKERRKKDPEKYAAKFREQARKKKLKNPHCQKDWNLRSTYNITFQDFITIITLQDNVCPICRRSFEDGKIDGSYGHVDHDHACCSGPKSCGKCVRGILCNKCNKGIGFFCDDVRSLEYACIYLQKERYVPDATSLYFAPDSP